MPNSSETPFDSIESAIEYIQLLIEAIAVADGDVEGEMALAQGENERRRLGALHLVRFRLNKLRACLESSRRILNDLRKLRNLLLSKI